MLIFDFDGTLTDAEAEGVPFLDGYLDDLCALTGATRDVIVELTDRFEAEIMASSDLYGWVFNGQIVAPASVDPYLRIMPVARKVFDHFDAFPGEDDRFRLLDGILYKYNYGKSAMAFREGAFELLASREGTPTWVVTNSATDPVRDKVGALAKLAGRPGALDWLVERIFGFAKKYYIDADWDEVQPTMSLPGLDRPVLLRRRPYFEVLDRLREGAGCSWSDVTVVGDIFELDLALPLHLGARVGLLVNRFTPPREVTFLSEHERGAALHSLADVAAFIE